MQSVMNNYNFKDLTVGMEHSFTVSITKDMMEGFRAITGDENPLHMDCEFAVSHGFSGNVVYGMLTASFLSTLAGVYIPGEKSLIQSVETKFTKPVYVGDTLVVKGVVDELNDTVKQITLKVEIRNQNNEKVLRGKMKVGMLDEGK